MFLFSAVEKYDLLSGDTMSFRVGFNNYQCSHNELDSHISTASK